MVTQSCEKVLSVLFCLLLLSCQAYSQNVGEGADTTQTNPAAPDASVAVDSTTQSVTTNSAARGRDGAGQSEKKSGETGSLLDDSSEVQTTGTGESLDDTTTISPLPIVFSTTDTDEEFLNVSDGLNGTNPKTPRKSAGIVTDEEVNLQTQIYVLSGVFGGTLLILIVVVVVLALQISRLKDEIGGELERYVPGPQHSQMLGYENGGFSRGAPSFSENSRFNASPTRQNFDNIGMQERSVDRDMDDLSQYNVYKGSSSSHQTKSHNGRRHQW